MIENKKKVSAFLLLLLTGFLIMPLYAATVPITVNGSVRQGTVPHFWNECVGTGTMEYCLKPAWITAAKIGAQEAGFKRVRGHGILIHLDNVDNILIGSSPNWNFSVIDKIYDTVIACGLKPVVELSFIPKSLQTNGSPNSPPNNYGTWKSLIAAFVSHLESRYTAAEVRKWYFEVWNEYDYSGFWTSDAAHYYTLYDSAAAGVRSVDTNIIVGGPATTNQGPLQNFWNSCNSYGIKFLSNHQYGVGSDQTISAIPTNIRDDNNSRSATIKGTGKNILSCNTEFNSSYGGQGGSTALNCKSMDDHRNAPFIAKVMKLIISDCIGGANRYPDILSYWTISDCFDEWGGKGNGTSTSFIEGNNNVPFGEVFGLINYQGIKKAAFNAYVMLNRMGTTGLEMTGGSADNDGIDGIATVNADSSQVSIMVYSYYNNLSTTGADNTVTLTINNLPFANGQLTVNHYRIDSLHSNPYGVWKRLGSPASPSTAVWDSLRAHQNLETMEPQSNVQYTGSPITKTLTMPRWSISMLTYTRQTTGIKLPVGTHLNINSTMFSMHGLTLKVSPQLQGIVEVSVYGVDGRLIKNVRSLQKSIDISAGLAKGTYMVNAEAAGIRFFKKIAVY